MADQRIARKFVVKGRVQGVGFRYYVQRAANAVGIRGYVRNLDDGTVEVYAIGTPDQLFELTGHLWKGPRFADVWAVDEKDAAVEAYSRFETRY